MLKTILRLFFVAIIYTPSTWANFPEKPIKIIVGFSAGSSTDIVARIIANNLSQITPQGVVVLNKPGADSSIAARDVKDAKPDGYTLFFASNSAIAETVLKRIPSYEILTDFTSIVSIAENSPPLLAVNQSSSIEAIEDLVRLSKQNPGNQTFYGVANATSYLHAEQFKKLTGITSTQIPFKSEVESALALTRGEIQWMFILPNTARSLVKGGKIKVIATPGTIRNPLFPETKTFRESGSPNLNKWETVGSVVAIVGPLGTPKEAVEWIHREVSRIKKTETVKRLLLQEGFTVTDSTPESLKKMFEERIKAWSKVVNDNNIPIKE